MLVARGNRLDDALLPDSLLLAIRIGRGGSMADVSSLSSREIT